MKKLGAWKGIMILVVVYVALGLASPHVLGRVLAVSRDYVVEMALIIPAVVVLMGLFEVWMPKDTIQRLLGRESGMKGMILAFFMGTAPTGPLYVAFPIASSLLKKGASSANLIVFLGAWAAAKVPQIAMEAKFLGIEFAIVRLGLTAIGLVIMGFVGEALLSNWGPDAFQEKGCSG